MLRKHTYSRLATQVFRSIGYLRAHVGLGAVKSECAAANSSNLLRCLDPAPRLQDDIDSEPPYVLHAWCRGADRRVFDSRLGKVLSHGACSGRCPLGEQDTVQFEQVSKSKRNNKHFDFAANWDPPISVSISGMAILIKIGGQRRVAGTADSGTAADTGDGSSSTPTAVTYSEPQ